MIAYRPAVLCALQFCPTNRYNNTAIRYTGRFQVHYKVQSRSLRKEHIDSYYAAAFFKNLRCFAIDIRDTLVAKGEFRD